MAAMNGLDPAAVLLTGTVMKLPNGAPAPAGASQPLPAARVVAQAGPAPAPGRLGADRIRQIASEQGAPASLAAAIAWQESGFNNAMVSSANARGIMQVMPGTWNWVQSNLGVGQLNPTSAEDNVRAGSAYLARLLTDAGGDERLAAAGTTRACTPSARAACTTTRDATSTTSSRYAGASAAEAAAAGGPATLTPAM